MSGFVPMMFIIRFMLYANTCRLISVLTRSRVFVKKWVDPIHASRDSPAGGATLRKNEVLSRIILNNSGR